MTDFKVSTQLEGQFPGFVRREAENLILFIKAYYEWMEREGGVVDETKDLIENRDIDTSADRFVEFFTSEFLSDFPENVLANKRLLVKSIRDLYSAKGSEKSYKLLFRILHDDDINLFYPGSVVLRASDGRWVQENSIRVSLEETGISSDDAFNFGGRRIVGTTSEATGKVERVVKRVELGISIFELFIDNLSGSFEGNEVVETLEGDISAKITSSIGPIESVEVDEGGFGYSVGDAVNFVADEGSGANGDVIDVDSSGIEFVIEDGGSGYTNSATITFGPSSGEGASFEITSISNIEIITTYNDILQCVSNVEVGADSYSEGNTCTISSNLASANLQVNTGTGLGTTNLEVGTINSISTTNTGTGYGILRPTVTVREDAVADLEIDDGSGGIKGLNAVITTEILSEEDTGKLIAVSVNERGQGYLPIQLSIVNVSNVNATDSLGTPTISGIVDYPGRYINTKGWLSWDNKIQDNHYYQEYSYEIISDEFIKAYRRLVDKLVHPAGTRMFGRVRIQDTVASNVETIAIEETITT